MFWGKKKPKKNLDRTVSGPNRYGDVKSVPVIPEPSVANNGLTRRQSSRQVLERMGGAQVIAAVIRTMMVEDRQKRRSTAAIQEEESDEA